jgi:glycerophosphoryl diester phosphodiesterase
LTELIPKPFASAHRAGNDRKKALLAIEAGADLLETDIWLHKGRLELRHKQTLGPIPVLWERWSIAPGWTPRYTLPELLNDAPDDILLFLDFKGDEMDLGPEVLKELQRSSPNRVVAICGRNYPQLQTIADAPNILCFYSVGDEKEWPVAQELVAASDYPALSIKASLATPERMDWMNGVRGTVVCWNVKSEQQMRELWELGVDGFTTDDPALINRIRQVRESRKD